jgi:hypothetical protein
MIDFHPPSFGLFGNGHSFRFLPGKLLHNSVVQQTPGGVVIVFIRMVDIETFLALNFPEFWPRNFWESGTDGVFGSQSLDFLRFSDEYSFDRKVRN